MSRALLAIPVFLLAGLTASAAGPPAVRNGPIVFVRESYPVNDPPTLLTVGADGRGLRWFAGPGDGRPVFAPRGASPPRTARTTTSLLRATIRSGRRTESGSLSSAAVGTCTAAGTSTWSAPTDPDFDALRRLEIPRSATLLRS